MSAVAAADSRLPRLLGRVLSGVPDALTSAFYLATWIAPLRYGGGMVANLMVVMLMEFFVVHAVANIGRNVLATDASRDEKAASILRLFGFYLLLAGGFAFAYDAWWALIALLWLLLSKFVQVLLMPEAAAGESERQIFFRDLGVGAYVTAIFLGILPFIPEFGVTAEVRSHLYLPGGGDWVKRPQAVLCSGYVYFAILAVAKWGYRPREPVAAR